MSSIALENNVVVDFDREVFEKEIDVKKVIGIVAGLAVSAAVGIASLFVISNRTVVAQVAIEENQFFGDGVSADIASSVEYTVENYFNDISVAEATQSLRTESKCSYDEADFQARAIELLKNQTVLTSIDKVTSIENEYRVYLTIATVNVDDLMAENQAYASQYFMSDRNYATEEGLNKMYLEILENNDELTSAVETYVTVNADGTIDCSQLVFVYSSILAEMRK